ncbi:TPA: tyrosine-type recombinase/integrase [Salmonella enterica subsp. enterica serovar Muenchen]
MSKESYPTGVENHGGSLRIWFKYKGKRVRENLGVPDTAKNRKVAGELRSSVCFAIRMGNFDYASQFPDSPNLKRFGLGKKDITVKALAKKWLDLKEMEISNNTMTRYQSVMKNMLPLLGENKQVSLITQESILLIRKELLTGYQTPKKRQKKTVKGRSVPTVNYYMAIISEMFKFAADNGYIAITPLNGITPLKKSRPEPDPLTQNEFDRLIEACHQQQLKNLWTLAVYTGMRHGELCALAWEDIDLKAGTLMVRRNYTRVKEFTLPKTDSGTDRVIYLTDPALAALKNQAALTRLGKQYQVEVKLREYGRTTTHPCTFVFNPQTIRQSKIFGHHYVVQSLSSAWEAAIKRAGLRYRKAYQSRHTYACWSLTAGANPSFIATQMGHASAQMLYSVYGKWMPESSADQVALLNHKLSACVPYMPQTRKVSK